MGLLKLKISGGAPIIIIYYFVVQEVCATLFVINFSLNFIIILLIIKGGFSPFHWWMVKLILSCHEGALWFITMQKLVYLITMSFMLRSSWVRFLYFWRFLPLLQGLFSRYTLIITFYLLTSRGNFILIIICWSKGFAIFLVYPYMWYIYKNLYSNSFISYEVSWIVIGFPGGLPFSIKVNALFRFSRSIPFLVIFILFILGLNLILGWSLYLCTVITFGRNKVVAPSIFILVLLFFFYS